MKYEECGGKSYIEKLLLKTYIKVNAKLVDFIEGLHTG